MALSPPPYRPSFQLPPDRVSREIQVDEVFDSPKANEEQQTEDIITKLEVPPEAVQEENINKRQELQGEENPGLLQEEIKRKEAEIEELKLALRRLSGDNPEDYGELYTRIDKAVWDKQVLDERRRITNNSLEQQILQKQKIRTMEEIERDKSIVERLKMLSNLKQAELRKRMEEINRAQKYSEDLSVQAALQKKLHEIEMHKYRAAIPRPKENPPPLSIIPDAKAQSPNYPYGIAYSPEKQYSPNSFYFTKKAPKTLTFNPITGELRDTALPEQKSFSHLNHRKFSPELGSYARTDDDRNRSFFKGAGNYIVNGK